MRDLTGAPSYKHTIKDNPDLFPKLIEGFENGFVMTLGNDNPDDEESKSVGLIKALRMNFLKDIKVDHFQSLGLDPNTQYSINQAARIKNKHGKIV